MELTPSKENITAQEDLQICPSPAHRYLLNSRVQFHSAIGWTIAMFYIDFVGQSIGSKREFNAVRHHHQSFRLVVKLVLS